MSTFLSTEELAQRWKTTKGYLANRRCDGLGPKFVKVGAKVLYPLEDIEQYEQDNTRSGSVDSGREGDESNV